MFSNNDLKKFNNFIKNISLQPTLYLRQKYFYERKDEFQDLIDYFFSFAFETKNYLIPSRISINDNSIIDFKKQFGEFVYYLEKGDKQRIKYTFNKFPTYLQNILIATSYSNTSTLLTIDYVLKNISHYFLFSEIKQNLIMPKFIDNVFETVISKTKINEIKFPIYLFDFPKHFKIEKLVYLFKDYDNVKSNINSQAIRRELLSKIVYPKYGVLGVLGKDKRFKNKYKLVLVYFNQNLQNVKDLYIGVESEIDNQIDKLEKIKFENIIIQQGKKFNEIGNLKNKLKKLKYSKKFVVLAENGIMLNQFKIEYDNARILDYIYNDEFDVIGLKIIYNDNIYSIYFNILNTIYINGIENKFVRIGIVKWFDEIINVFYNSEVYAWDKNYDYCLMCLDIKYKHAYSGLCHRCVNKLKTITENLSKPIKIKCNRNFEIVVNKVKFKADGEYLTCEIPKYYQLSLPLFDNFDVCS